MFLLHYLHIFCLRRQGLIRLSARLIKASEKFQKLQAHIVDVAAQQIQRQVQCVADQRDDNEGDDLAEGGAQGVEHPGNDGTGQHQPEDLSGQETERERAGLHDGHGSDGHHMDGT